MKSQYLEDLSLSPFLQDLKGYRWPAIRRDLMAALSVALLTIPQAMGYALLAGLPMVCGLYTAIFGALTAALFCSSRHLVIGPSNAIAILVQAGTAEILFTYFRDLTGVDREMMAVHVMGQLCILVACFQTLAAVFKLGRLIQFVSHSVIIGYVSGVTLALVIHQLFVFLGIPSLSGVWSLYERVSYLVTHLTEIKLATASIGVGTIAVILLLRPLNLQVPAVGVALVVSTVTVYLLGWGPEGHAIEKVLVVGDIGGISSLWAAWSWPYIDIGIINKLVPIAFALALMSILETSAVAKSIAANSGEVLSNNQDILGLGTANFVSACAGGMPCSASPSRSSLLYYNRSKTRFAAAFAALFVALIIGIFDSFVPMVPLAALAAVLLVNVPNIVDRRQLALCLKATPADATVLLATVGACLFFNLDIAFYIGVIMSITLYLRKAAVPHLTECTFQTAEHMMELSTPEHEMLQQVKMIDVRGELFFGAVDLFQTTLKSIAEDANVKVIILRLKNARDLDATACLALQQLHDYLTSSGRLLIACSLTTQTWKILQDSGLVAQIGSYNLFLLDKRHPHDAEQQALLRAMGWLQGHPPVIEFPVEVPAAIPEPILS